MRLVDLTLSFPFLVLVIVLAAFFGRGLITTVVVIGAVLWARPARVLRSQVIKVREFQHVTAARAMGASSGPHPRPATSLPRVAPLAAAQFVRAANVSVLIEASLAVPRSRRRQPGQLGHDALLRQRPQRLPHRRLAVVDRSARTRPHRRRRRVRVHGLRGGGVGRSAGWPGAPVRKAPRRPSKKRPPAPAPVTTDGPVLAVARPQRALPHAGGARSGRRPRRPHGGAWSHHRTGRRVGQRQEHHGRVDHGVLARPPAKVSSGEIVLEGQDLRLLKRSQLTAAAGPAHRHHPPERHERPEPGLHHSPPGHGGGTADPSCRRGRTPGPPSCWSWSGSPKRAAPVLPPRAQWRDAAAGRSSAWPWPTSRRSSWPTSR